MDAGAGIRLAPGRAKFPAWASQAEFFGFLESSARSHCIEKVQSNDCSDTDVLN
jgi:hypothetical protein